MFKYKKHALAVALGAMFAAPAFADPVEGIIYQQDQTNAQATINQVADDGFPQAAAIVQTDTTGSNAVTNNIATVIQGAISGTNTSVTIDPSGAPGANTFNTISATLDGTVAGTNAAGVVTFPDQTDSNTGDSAYLYLITGVASGNYGLVMQNSQIKSNATIIQGTSTDVDNALAAQDSLTNANLNANANNDTQPNIFVSGTGVVANLTDNNNANSPVVITYGGGVLTFQTDGSTAVQLGGGAFDESNPAEGNLAIVGQGNHLAFTIINPGIGNNAVDVDDSFADGTNETSNIALAIQDGQNGYASIGQQGNLNAAAILQNGDSNAAEIYQYEGDLGSPNNNYALVAQAGNTNLAQVYQTGFFNSASVYQLGDGHIALVDQDVGATAALNGAVAFIYQSGPLTGAGAASGSGNYASVYQHSSGS